MKTHVPVFAACVLLAAAASQARAATVHVDLDDLTVSATPGLPLVSPLTPYTGTLSVGSDNGSSAAFSGGLPPFSGTLAGNTFSVAGTFGFTSSQLNPGARLILTTTSPGGGGDVMTLLFAKDALLLGGSLGFETTLAITSASLTDGNGDGKFGSITMPLDFFGAGAGDLAGHTYTLKFICPVPDDSACFDACLYGCQQQDPPPVPLPAAVYGGASLLGVLGIGRFLRRRAL